MFRKITSNRPPEISFWTALHREGGQTLQNSGDRIRRGIEARPRLFFLLMTGSILLSVVCFYTLPKRPSVLEAAPFSAAQPLSAGVRSMVSAASDLRQLLEIRLLLDELLQKDVLDGADSLLMDQAIKQMHLLEKKMSESGAG